MTILNKWEDADLSTAPVLTAKPINIKRWELNNPVIAIPGDGIQATITKADGSKEKTDTLPINDRMYIDHILKFELLTEFGDAGVGVIFAGKKL